MRSSCGRTGEVRNEAAANSGTTARKKAGRRQEEAGRRQEEAGDRIFVPKKETASERYFQYAHRLQGELAISGYRQPCKIFWLAPVLKLNCKQNTDSQFQVKNILLPLPKRFRQRSDRGL
jgi:hypothetical protein